MKKILLNSLGMLGMVIVILLVLICIPSIVTVSPTQRAVITRFGTLSGTTLTQGTFFEPFANLVYYDLNAQTLQSTETAGSKDAQNVSVKVNFTYYLNSDKVIDLYKNVGTLATLNSNFLTPTISQAVKQATAQFGAQELLPRQADFQAEVLKDVMAQVDQTYIKIGSVTIVDVNFSDAYNKAIEDKQVAQQNAEKAQYDLQTAQLQAKQQEALQQSLTPAILQKMALDKWNGVLPATMTGNDTIFSIPTK